jgi:hypothetical protein
MMLRTLKKWVGGTSVVTGVGLGVGIGTLAAYREAGIDASGAYAALVKEWKSQQSRLPPMDSTARPIGSDMVGALDDLLDLTRCFSTNTNTNSGTGQSRRLCLTSEELARIKLSMCRLYKKASVDDVVSGTWLHDVSQNRFSLRLPECLWE